MKHLHSFEVFNESINRNDIEIKFGLDDDQFKSICHLCANELSSELEEVSAEDIYDDLYENSDPKYSSAAYDRNSGELIGGLCCKIQTIKESIGNYPEAGVEYYYNIDGYDNKNGIEGVALSVKSEYRNSFAVFKLLHTLEGLDFDYIIIQQFESLKSNINYLNKGCKKLCKLTTPEFEESILFYIKNI